MRRTHSRKERTFWITFDPLLDGDWRFQAFASKASAKGRAAETNVERRENREERVRIEGPFLVLEPEPREQ